MHATSFHQKRKHLFIESRHWSCRAVNLTNVRHTYIRDTCAWACARFLFSLHLIPNCLLISQWNFFRVLRAGSSMPRSMCLFLSLSMWVSVFINFHLEMSVKIILKSVKIDMSRAQEPQFYKRNVYSEKLKLLCVHLRASVKLYMNTC